MARPATSATGSSTIAQPPANTTAKATTLSKALLGMRRVFFTAADLADPIKLYRLLHDFQQNVAAALRPLAENRALSGNDLTGIVFQAGQTVTLAHGLGRPYVGAYCVHRVDGSWRGREEALPPGTTSAQFIALSSPMPGTFDFRVF